MDAINHRYGGGIPPNPRGGGGGGGGAAHRRAHSETFLRLPDDILFDSDPDFGISDIDFPSLSDDKATSASASASGGGGGAPQSPPLLGGDSAQSGRHVRSLSVDAAFFDTLAFQGAPGGGGGGVRPHHRHGGSMDGSEGESAPPGDYARKAMAPDKLAELALLDPRRAKRVLANRQSAARSKERKIRYTSELEQKVQTLQTEATTLSAQLTLLQRDTTGLTTENRELKFRLQAMQQQAQLRDALNEALREEVQRLKIATGQLPNGNENVFNGGIQQSVSPFFSQPQHSSNSNSHQAQQQLHPPQSQASSNDLCDRSLHDSMDFM